MSVGIGRISKGLFQRSIENVANDEGLRPEFLKTLQKDPVTSETDWIDFLRDRGGLDRAAERYLRDQWLRFWEPDYPDYSPDIIEKMLRQSLIKAIELANSLPTPVGKKLMPIDCHWIWTDNDNKFEVLIACNEQQVTRILLTPRPPTELSIPLHFRAPYFIVKLGPIDRELELEINPIQEQEQAEASGAPVYQGEQLRVVTVQLKSVR